MSADSLTVPDAGTRPATQRGRLGVPTIMPLAGTEFRLLSREWAAMLFAFVFPPLMLVVLAGSFGNQPDEAFGGVLPSDYYVAAYIGIPLGALALLGLPIMVASYRERDVLRRFEAFGVATVKVITAQALVTCALVVLAAALVVAVAAPTYGVPAVEDPLRTLAGFVLGTVTMIVLGLALGLSVRTARSAQALGMLAFLPMWLLGGGGPPRDILSDGMSRVSDVLPLWHVTAAIREPWLGTGSGGTHLLVLTGWLIVGLVAVTLLLRRRNG
ncbi:MAG: ABC transporter permease [Geodermatophilaceae bacterium]